MRNHLIAVLILCVACLAADAPQSKTARMADERRATAIDKARKVYQLATVEAEKQYVITLQGLMQAAMKSGNADEVVRLKAAIAEGEKRYADAKGAIDGRTFQIDARKDWQSTIEVTKGTEIAIIASGRWCYFTKDRENATVSAAGGMREGKRYGVLVAKVGDGDVQVIGDNGSFVASRDGRLFFCMQDDGRSDNDGELVIRLFATPQ